MRVFAHAPSHPLKTNRAACQHARTCRVAAMNEIAEREANGRFLPGFTPNPSGRPKIVDEIRQLARQHAPDAFKRVCELVDSEDERTALAAAQEILNRAYGRPMQAIEQTIEHTDIRQLYLE